MHSSLLARKASMNQGIRWSIPYCDVVPQPPLEHEARALEYGYMFATNGIGFSEQPVQAKASESEPFDELQEHHEKLGVPVVVCGKARLEQEREFSAAMFPCDVNQPAVSDKAAVFEQAQQDVVRLRLFERRPDLTGEVGRLLGRIDRCGLAQHVHLGVAPLPDRLDMRILYGDERELTFADGAVRQAGIVAFWGGQPGSLAQSITQ